MSANDYKFNINANKLVICYTGPAKINRGAPIWVFTDIPITDISATKLPIPMPIPIYTLLLCNIMCKSNACFSVCSIN